MARVKSLKLGTLRTISLLLLLSLLVAVNSASFLLAGAWCVFARAGGRPLMVALRLDLLVLCCGTLLLSSISIGCLMMVVF